MTKAVVEARLRVRNYIKLYRAQQFRKQNSKTAFYSGANSANWQVISVQGSRIFISATLTQNSELIVSRAANRIFTGGSPLAFLERPQEPAMAVAGAARGGSASVSEGMKLGNVTYVEGRAGGGNGGGGGGGFLGLGNLFSQRWW